MKRLFLVLAVISLFLTNSQILNAHADSHSSFNSHGHECCFFNSSANAHTNLIAPNPLQNSFNSHAYSTMHEAMPKMDFAAPCHSKNNMDHFLKMQRLKGVVQRK